MRKSVDFLATNYAKYAYYDNNNTVFILLRAPQKN